MNLFICFLFELIFEFSTKLNPLSGRHLFWGGKFFGQFSPRLIKEIGQRGSDQHLRPTNQPTGAVKPVTRSSPAFEIHWDLLRPHIFKSNIILFKFKSPIITQQSNRSCCLGSKQEPPPIAGHPKVVNLQRIHIYSPNRTNPVPTDSEAEKNVWDKLSDCKRSQESIWSIYLFSCFRPTKNIWKKLSPSTYCR